MTTPASPKKEAGSGIGGPSPRDATNADAPPVPMPPSASSELDRLTRILPGHPDLSRELRRSPALADEPLGEGGPGDRLGWP